MKQIDLNCDIGEGFGTYHSGLDTDIMPYISSANIACGFHAGDFSTMNQTVELALEHHVAIGAHPSLPDLQGFGRRRMAVSPREAFEMVLYQIGALHGFVVAHGAKLHHVKPHGALYNMAATDFALAEAIAEAAYHFHPQLILYGLAGSELIKAGEKLGLSTASEVFADRTYQSDGTLTPRSQPNALIQDAKQAVSQAVRMVKEEKVRSVDGIDISVQADTICLHGDSSSALDFARQLNQRFATEEIYIKTY
ncbi:LamB/YcsF family protein [Lederbergia sp. NSJ-179]|uniref:LamB/YcsF family protein n=1 Tax=Lederbergia sp. NSJ-179 TaxID=2931402 RepID=UPI001FD5EE3C|nr:5-oxoprolinase subunit PxpA [Lederbergia sp. NSJ-179]MCJ7842600.1 LamB/YcsF family protein [Lederbergia sp. NSJ-179]